MKISAPFYAIILLMKNDRCDKEGYLYPFFQAWFRFPMRYLTPLGIKERLKKQAESSKRCVDTYQLVYRGKIRTWLGAELLRVMRRLPNQMSEIHLPVLIMSGTDDRLSDPEGSQLLYERISSRGKTLKFYDGFYHEIFNEPGRDQVFSDMDDWLTAHP